MQVLVRNLNKYEYREEFNGDLITIGPDEAIKMDNMKARQFLGQFTTPVLDGQGRPDPRYLKRLRIEEIPDQKPVEAENKQVYVCQMDGKEFKSQAELDQHIADNWAEDIVDEDAQKAMRKKTRKR